MLRLYRNRNELRQSFEVGAFPEMGPLKRPLWRRRPHNPFSHRMRPPVACRAVALTTQMASTAPLPESEAGRATKPLCLVAKMIVIPGDPALTLLEPAVMATRRGTTESPGKECGEGLLAPGRPSPDDPLIPLSESKKAADVFLASGNSDPLAQSTNGCLVSLRSTTRSEAVRLRALTVPRYTVSARVCWGRPGLKLTAHTTTFILGVPLRQQLDRTALIVR